MIGLTMRSVTWNWFPIKNLWLILLRSEIPSGMCAKLRTVAASNKRDHPTRSLYYCLFAPHTYIFVLRAHPVRGESHNQRNTTGEVATIPCFHLWSEVTWTCLSCVGRDRISSVEKCLAVLCVTPGRTPKRLCKPLQRKAARGSHIPAKPKEATVWTALNDRKYYRIVFRR